MCGVIAYMGAQAAYPILMQGLRRLEYRGYDSAGIAVMGPRDFHLSKKAGKLDNLQLLQEGRNITGHTGIGHTRWATHGIPNDTNAHPHLSRSGRLAIVHNGIIENYSVLKARLLQRGYSFVSHTDTEVLINLVEELQLQEALSLEEAVRAALNEIVGAYALIIMDSSDEDTLIAARKGAPLVLGIGTDEYFIASDPSAILTYTRNVIYLEDDEYTVIRRQTGVHIRSLDNREKTPYIEALEMDLEALEKGSFAHFMLKEIHEQPQAIENALRGRLNAAQNRVTLGGITEHINRFKQATRFIITACGTSYHAGLLGKYLIEELARVPVSVEYASEFRYRNPIIRDNDIVLAVSQSGETADTLAAITLAKSGGALVYGICNVVGSSIARYSHAGSYTHAGPEIGVASTKAFSTQLVLLTLMAIQVAEEKNTISPSLKQSLLLELERIPDKIKQVLVQNDTAIQSLASRFYEAAHFLYLGRGLNFPVALEGALKLKEISYIHAEGYAAAEMKHGPIALIDKKMPVVVLATNSSARDKIISNIQEVKAREGIVIAIINEDDQEISELADYAMYIPVTEELLSPLLTIIPLQLLCYHIALLRGCDVDQPRNLAKSVTVE